MGATAAARLSTPVEHWRDCGNVKALHVGIDAYRVYCATS
jgi:hypothetical protein